MKVMDVLAAVLVIVGALNWGLVGVARFDLVATLFGMEFGEASAITSVVYALVGLAAVYQVLTWNRVQLNMKRTVSVSMMAVAILLPAGAAAQEESIEGQWSMRIVLGAEAPAGGEFHQGGTGAVLGLATSVDPKSSADIFSNGFGWGVGVGYGVSRNIEVFGDFN